MRGERDAVSRTEARYDCRSFVRIDLVAQDDGY